jgi:hypothetical protein
MMRKIVLGVVLVAITVSCKKNEDKQLRYFEVGIVDITADWRDSSFIVATANPHLIEQIQVQLSVPVNQRKILNGALRKGNAGYNNNGSHSFSWHFNEDDWQFTDFSIEIYDGRAYSDLDLNPDYWHDTVKRFSPWNSYIRKEIIR